MKLQAYNLLYYKEKMDAPIPLYVVWPLYSTFLIPTVIDRVILILSYLLP